MIVQYLNIPIQNYFCLIILLTSEKIIEYNKNI